MLNCTLSGIIKPGNIRKIVRVEGKKININIQDYGACVLWHNIIRKPREIKKGAIIIFDTSMGGTTPHGKAEFIVEDIIETD